MNPKFIKSMDVQCGFSRDGLAGYVPSRNDTKMHSLNVALRGSIIGALLACFVSGAPESVLAADQKTDLPAFAPGMINHMQAMRRFKDTDRGVQSAPVIIPKFEIDRDPSGAVATLQTSGRTHSEQCVLPESWDQWEDLFHLPSTGDRLDRQRRECR